MTFYYQINKKYITKRNRQVQHYRPQREHESKLVRFYSGVGTDQTHHTIGQVWHFDTRTLEKNHEYIQWLFPIRQRSMYNPHAPVLTKRDITIFNHSSFLKKRINTSFDVMLHFYGLKQIVQHSKLTVIETPRFQKQSKFWLTPMNHNFKRFTRILKSLHLLGLKRQFHAFLNYLVHVLYPKSQHIIDLTTLDYWTYVLDQ